MKYSINTLRCMTLTRSQTDLEYEKRLAERKKLREERKKADAPAVAATIVYHNITHHRRNLSHTTIQAAPAPVLASVSEPVRSIGWSVPHRSHI